MRRLRRSSEVRRDSGRGRARRPREPSSMGTVIGRRLSCVRTGFRRSRASSACVGDCNQMVRLFCISWAITMNTTWLTRNFFEDAVKSWERKLRGQSCPRDLLERVDPSGSYSRSGPMVLILRGSRGRHVRRGTRDAPKNDRAGWVSSCALCPLAGVSMTRACEPQSLGFALMEGFLSVPVARE